MCVLSSCIFEFVQFLPFIYISISIGLSNLTLLSPTLCSIVVHIYMLPCIANIGEFNDIKRNEVDNSNSRVIHYYALEELSCKSGHLKRIQQSWRGENRY